MCSGLLAFFADDVEGQPVRGSGVVHLVLAFVAFTAVAVGTVATSMALRSLPRWDRVGNLQLALSVLGAVAYLLLGAALKHRHGPGGLYERIFLGIELAWLGLTAWHCARFDVVGQPHSRAGTA